MSDKQTSTNQKATSDSTDVAANSRKELDQVIADADEKGYFGEVPDETPNEDYTLQGVAKKGRATK